MHNLKIQMADDEEKLRGLAHESRRGYDALYGRAVFALFPLYKSLEAHKKTGDSWVREYGEGQMSDTVLVGKIDSLFNRTVFEIDSFLHRHSDYLGIKDEILDRKLKVLREKPYLYKKLQGSEWIHFKQQGYSAYYSTTPHVFAFAEEVRSVLLFLRDIQLDVTKGNGEFIPDAFADFSNPDSLFLSFNLVEKTVRLTPSNSFLVFEGDTLIPSKKSVFQWQGVLKKEQSDNRSGTFFFVDPFTQDTLETIFQAYNFVRH